MLFYIQSINYVQSEAIMEVEKIKYEWHSRAGKLSKNVSKTNI